MVNQSVRHIHTSRNLFRSGGHPIPEKGPPFVLENQTRYLGEDAMFSCGMSFNGTISEIDHVLWLKNNEAIVNGTNHYITWEFANYSESRVKVTTNLTIYSVTEDDFGMYQCYVTILESVKPTNDTKQKPKPKRRTENVDCSCRCVNSPSLRMPEFSKEDIQLLYYILHKFHWIGEFHLLREKPRIRTLFIVPGTLVTVTVYFRHLREIDDFSVRFTRSGQDIQSFDTQCSYSVRANALLLYLNGISVAYNNITYMNATEVDHWMASIGTIWTCISPSMYGVYQITILRKIYHKHDNTQWIEKIDYPTKVYIKPKESTIVTENISNNKNRAVVVYNESCWSNEELKPESCEHINTLVESIFDKNILYENLITRNIVILLFGAILISGIIVFFISPFMWCKISQCYFVMKMSGKKGLAGIQVNPDLQYHLYISSSSAPSDRSFIEQNILPIIKPLDLNVFCGQEDVLPGSFEITEISNAINKSLKCLVIATKKYIETPLQNYFEMNCILGSFSICDLVIVNVDNCLINKRFDTMYTVINCSREGLSEKDKTVLMHWAVKGRQIIPNVTQKSLLSKIKSCIKLFYR
ncbi:hypothetical protein LOTGIDRAFT_167288 [Lottia gigantea]|uniref:Ig-like domain-containing protein n=1 Tax=Lottia gigantea TaxID=225164 RepID=V3ZUI8_LOTGI|nr:hypothetical protein LOTGIDRAFT_167288 [Lottia gigantea]ESO86245.1 hypothetical protein LOTGIDRAFT_167288 [Lottia gigantea]